MGPKEKRRILQESTRALRFHGHLYNGVGHHFITGEAMLPDFKELFGQISHSR